MRIKCPNTEIMLELPGDRTDMKFACPACKMVHRVTVSITTPGGEGPDAVSGVDAHQRLAKDQLQSPVVDVPIDANFILLDSSSAGAPGVDLGVAAQQAVLPVPGGELPGRKTEIIEDRRPGRMSVVADSGETQLEDGTVSLSPASIYPAGVLGEHGPSTVSRRRRAGAAVLALAALLVVVLAGYLGWQQYLFNQAGREAGELLGRADSAWQEGNTAASADAARQAGAVLEKAEILSTPERLWNRLARWSGAFTPRPDADAAARERISAILRREKSLASFRSALDPADAPAMAALFRESAPAAASDSALLHAMEKALVDLSLERLRRDATDLQPETARSRANANFQDLRSVLSDANRDYYHNQISAFNDSQRRRLGDEAREEAAAIVNAAMSGNFSAITRYRILSERLRDSGIPEFSGAVEDLAEEVDREALQQLAALSEIISQAESAARSVLSRADSDATEAEIDRLSTMAAGVTIPNPVMAGAAEKLVEDTRAQADELLNQRMEVYSRIQTEGRRNREYPGTRMALAMLSAGFDDPEVLIDPSGFRFDTNRAAMSFTIDGLPAAMEMNEEDYQNRIRATVGGYNFSAGWAPLFHKPLSWMVKAARDMRSAGIDPARYTEWEVMEGPGGLLALSVPGGSVSGMALASPASERHVFWQGGMHLVHELPQPADKARVVDDFRRAAERLEAAVMDADQISMSLRQALKPVLMGTYQPPDPRDYFDSAFCRRLIEADYLETYISPVPPAVQRALDSYRAALGKLEAGYDEFAVSLDDGSRLYAVVRPDAEFSGDGQSSDQDPETGESIPRYSWRQEKDGETVFYSPMPSRFIYAFTLAEHYQGSHKIPPPGVPELTEVWHISRGRVASYRDGDDRATGDAERWDDAIAIDLSGRWRIESSYGAPGWNFPLHVLQRDDQGDPVLLATLSGVVKSPDFGGIDDAEERRRAEDEWLDSTAETFSTPGELGLIFHQFFRYCSDSPLPELPNLIGSHYGLSDTHQTVYESLERRWVGRLIGDCDDLAEVFQVLTRRQGKLSHVMQLPGHAAAGYVEQREDGNYRFVVLQTGPVMQFNAPTLIGAVELAYRSFDRDEGMSHMTMDAVPLLLRFADEETRTPFVLSARIYGDAEYAETMIQVQAYWHEHVYSAAIAVMEEVVKEDQEIGNIKELGSLYERVGFYERSAELRNRELELVGRDPQAVISTLLELVQLRLQEKDKDKALEALGRMEEVMQDMVDRNDVPGFFRCMTFRSFWAMYLARLGQPARAWNLLRYDAVITKQQLGRPADPVLRTLVFLYERMSMARDAGWPDLSEMERSRSERAMDEVRQELDEAFGRGYFKSDDSYNTILGRYFVLGRYAVSDMGRSEGLERLLEDGPFPSGPKDQTRRTRGLSDADWEWFRISPTLYLALGMEMLDEDEYPELYDPVGAKSILEKVRRAVEKGTGLGSDVTGSDDVLKAELILAFLNDDLDAFRDAMSVVKEKDYSSLYDDAAMTFGLQCGLIPLSEFQDWIDAYHEFFPGSQHYFKVVYRALDKEHYDHALMMAEATARFFPDMELLIKERDFVRSIIPDLKKRKAARE